MFENDTYLGFNLYQGNLLNVKRKDLELFNN
jgi:hypothetical protein